MRRATATDWKLAPLPARRADLGFQAIYTAAEADRLMRGLIPETIQDKWFVYFADGWLLFHRSWTGYGVFGLRLEPHDEGQRVVASWVSREPDEYRGTDASLDRHDLTRLIERWLQGG